MGWFVVRSAMRRDIFWIRNDKHVHSAEALVLLKKKQKKRGISPPPLLPAGSRLTLSEDVS
jgi:hypothetical protein